MNDQTEITDREWDEFAEEFHFMARLTGGARYQVLLDLMPDNADRVLDAGCGTGLLATHLAKRVRHVVGLDISPAMMAVARRHQAEEEQQNVSFVFADLEAPPFPDHSFDFVVAASSMQRTRLEVSLRALRRLVRPGGRLALYVNVSWCPRLRDWWLARVLMMAPAAGKYVTLYGFRTMWRLIRLQTGRSWLQQGRAAQRLRARGGGVGDRGRIAGRPVPSPGALRAVCEATLPGCRVARAHRWAMTVVWEAPRP